MKYLYQSYPLKSNYYTQLIPELTRLIFLERNNLSTLIKEITEKVDQINNNFIYFDNSPLKLIDIYGKKINHLLKIEQSLNILLNINYFKKTINSLIKYLIYQKILNSKKVFLNKKTINNDKFTNLLNLINPKYIYLRKLIKKIMDKEILF